MKTAGEEMTATIFWKLEHSRMYGNWVGRHEKVESKVNSGKIQNATYFTQQKPRKFQDWGWCWKQNEVESLVVSKQMSRFSSSVPSKDWRTVLPRENTGQTPGTAVGRKYLIKNWKIGKNLSTYWMLTLQLYSSSCLLNAGSAGNTTGTGRYWSFLL